MGPARPCFLASVNGILKTLLPRDCGKDPQSSRVRPAAQTQQQGDPWLQLCHKPHDPLFIKALSQLSEGTSDILLQPSACLQRGGDGGAEVNPQAPPVTDTDRAPTERLTRLWVLHLGTPGVPGPFEGRDGDTEAQRDDSIRHTAGRLWSF